MCGNGKVLEWFLMPTEQDEHEGCQPMYNFQEASNLMTNIINVTKGYLHQKYQIKERFTIE
jgi:hypothetical protein